jgi:hypothetical protein
MGRMSTGNAAFEEMLRTQGTSFPCILSLMAIRVKGGRGALATALAAATLSLAAFAQAPHAAAALSAQRRPVLVELFTSEGCSDCPPADALLGELDAEQFVPGAQAIVLSEHVTYWNHDGWRDPFSFEQMTERQQQYARQFLLSDIYTPQMVVDGSMQFVGNDPAKLRGAVARAAAAPPKLDLMIEGAHEAADGSIGFAVRAADSGDSLFAAVAENATVSQVAHGENAGRTLHHVAVVRVLTEFGSGRTDGRLLELSGANLMAAEKAGGPLRLVVFIVNQRSGHVVGVAQQILNQPAQGPIEQTARTEQAAK